MSPELNRALTHIIDYIQCIGGKNMDSVHVLGGDFRSYYAALELTRRKVDVYLSGFDLLLSCDRGINKVSLTKSTGSEVMILPVPYRTGDGYIKLPHSKSDYTLEQVLEIHRPKLVVLGMVDDEAKSCFESRGVRYIDLLKCPMFVEKNAWLTAQAAASCVFEKSDLAPSDVSVLIMGAGRVGKGLARLLKSYGANVTVSARKQADFDYLAAHDLHFVETGAILETIGAYDVVVNTIPTPILGEREVKRMREGAFCVELASAPHGINFEACARHNVRCYLEMSLPGRYYPVSSGRAIADAFCVLTRTGV